MIYVQNNNLHVRYKHIKFPNRPLKNNNAKSLDERKPQHQRFHVSLWNSKMPAFVKEKVWRCLKH